jgi:hypothetical protein
MRIGRLPASLAAALALSSAFGAAVGAAARASAAAPAKQAVVTVGAAPVGRAIPPGFVGLSIEFPGLSAYAGDDPAAPNPILLQLIRNLAPGQQPVLRIGGDSTDWTWWPIPGISKPRGIRFTLSQRWLAISRALTQALDARLILGINLEADSGRVAAGEAQALLDGFGRSSVQALELGNEPELYSAFAWYKTATGRRVLGRPKGWAYPAFARDFSSIARSLPRVPLAGPSVGSPQWSPNLGPFLRATPRVALATLHRYPLKRCTASTHLTAGQLLSDASAKGLADGVARSVATARARGIPLRIDEMNSISCGGQRGLSDTYASALWALDALYEMARVGVDGVNIHTAPNRVNELFSFHHSSSGWEGSVNPLYYGMLTFAQAAPAGSRLLPVSGQVPGPVRVWATRATDGTVRAVLINDGPRSQTIKLRLPGNATTASLELLQAPSVTAKSAITLADQSFGGQTTTGLLAGTANTPMLTAVAGVYTVTLPGASAALLTA